MTKKASSEAQTHNPWGNIHSDLVKSLSSNDYQENSFFPLQDGDQDVGHASQYALRLAAEIKKQYDKSLRYQDLINTDEDHAHRSHLYNSLHDIELRLITLVGLYFTHLSYEFKGTWEGPPLFVLRADDRVVVTAKHRRIYSAQKRHSSKRITAVAPFFLDIVLSSFENHA